MVGVHARTLKTLRMVDFSLSFLFVYILYPTSFFVEMKYYLILNISSFDVIVIVQIDIGSNEVYLV